MKSGVNLNKISKVVELAFENALRLHFDSILLFENESYPSAYFLSILALEELGKVTLLDYFVWHSRISGRRSSKDEQDYIDSIFRHQLKQKVFANQAEYFVPKNMLDNFRSGNIEIMKQNAVYVGLERKNREANLKGKVITPYNVSMKKARQQITVVNDFLIDLTLGTIKEIYKIDTEGVEMMLNEELLSELTEQWKFRGRRASSRIKQLQAIS
jgi:AbiV family abortive infection protein